MAVVRLEISPTAAHVRTARLVAVAMARLSGVGEPLFDEIRLAVGEACSRAVGLHRAYGRPELVAMEFSGDSRFHVSVRDHAPAALIGDEPADPMSLLEAGAEAGRQKVKQVGDETAEFDMTAFRATRAEVAAEDGGPDVFSEVEPTVKLDEAYGVNGSEAVDEFSEEELVAGVGLALLAGLVDEVSVMPAEDGPGTVVRMSWPVN